MAHSEVLEALAQERPPILVYQMGKVGSTTIVDSLRRTSVKKSVLHLHFLSDDLERVRQEHREAGIDPLPYHLEISSALRWQLEQAKSLQFQAVTLVREPISWKLSDCFENPEFNGLCPETRSEELTAYLRKLLDEHSICQQQEQWFESEIKGVMDLDVFASPFSRAEGWQVLGNLLILRLEDLSRVGPTVLADFFGLPGPVQLLAGNKQTHSAYRRLIENFRVPEALADKIYSTRLVRHFYDEALIRSFRARWCGR